MHVGRMSENKTLSSTALLPMVSHSVSAESKQRQLEPKPSTGMAHGGPENDIIDI